MTRSSAGVPAVPVSFRYNVKYVVAKKRYQPSKKRRRNRMRGGCAAISGLLYARCTHASNQSRVESQHTESKFTVSRSRVIIKDKQQTTPKPTQTHTLLSGREPAGPLHATPYPHCGGQAQLGPPARLGCFHQPHLHSCMYVSESSQSVAFFPNLSQVSGHAHRQGSVTKIRERRDSQKRVLTDTLSIYLPPNLLLRTQTFFYA